LGGLEDVAGPGPDRTEDRPSCRDAPHARARPCRKLRTPDQRGCLEVERMRRLGWHADAADTTATQPNTEPSLLQATSTEDRSVDPPDVDVLASDGVLACP
jgi:hypothetical protein